MDEEFILFSAQWNNDGFTAGADAAMDSMNKVKSSVDELKASNETLKKSNDDLKRSITSLSTDTKMLQTENKTLSSTTKELVKDQKFIESEMKKVKKEMDGVNKATREGRQTLSELGRRYKELQAELSATTQRIIANTGAIDANTKRIQVNQATVLKSNETIKQNTLVMKQNEAQIKSLEQASNKGVGAIGRLWGGLRTVANLLPGIGIAGLVGLMAEWIVKMVQAGESLDTLAGKRKIFEEVNEKAADAAKADIARLEMIKQKLNDLTIPESQRLIALREYNKVADEQNKIDEKQIGNLTLINEKIEQQSRLIIQRAVALAATAKLAEFADAYVEKQLTLTQRAREVGLDEATFRAKVEELFLKRAKIVEDFANGRGSRAALSRANQAIDREIKKLLGGIDAEEIVLQANEARKELDRAGQLLSGLIDPQDLVRGKTGNTPENVFRQKLAELRTRLTAAQLAEFQSEPLIRRKFSEQLDKEFIEIGKLLKEKRLTVPQADILRGLIRQINEIDLARSLEEFRKKQEDAINKINDAIYQAQVEAANKRIANNRDEFDREREQIIAAYETTEKALADRLKAAQKQIADDVKRGLLTQEQADEKNEILVAIYGDILDQAGRARTNAQLELSFKMFQDTIREAKRALDKELLDLSEGSTGAIQLETERLLQGSLTYEQYQKKITKILRDEANERRRLQLQELNEELARINTRLSGTSDATQRKALEDQQRAVRGQISSLSRDIANAEAKEEQERQGQRIKNILAYAQAVQGLLSTIVQFWNQVNATEQAALERSIALQERRVENAKEIAERGNAEYLELEQKRLDELERKREENARRQIAINNALTLSQAIVAMIGAIAQAVTTGSPLAAIGAVGATIGAIGAAYAFVNSLEPQSTQFYQGAEYVDDPNKPRGKDTIPARLNIGERVVTTDKNQAYWDTLTAIHNGTIPPDVLNKFVKAYNSGAFATIDYEALTEATNNKLGYDSFELLQKLDTTNTKLDDVVDAVSSIAINLKMDSEGFAGSIASHLKKKAIKANA